MDKKHELLAISNPDGTVTLALGPGVVNNLSVQDAIKYALVILQSAQNASYLNGFKPSDSKADSEEQIIGFRPDALGSLGLDERGLASLVVCVGRGKFSLDLEKQQLTLLVQLLQTASAARGAGH